MARYGEPYWICCPTRPTEAIPPKRFTRFVLHKHLSVTPSNNKHSTPPSNCHQAVGAPSLPVQRGRAVGHPLETGHRRDATPRIRLNRRARRAPTDRPTLTQSRTARRLAGVRIGENHSHSRVGWADALEAPSRGRCGMVPFVSVRLEIIAARRLMPLPSLPMKFGTVCLSKSRPSSF